MTATPTTDKASDTPESFTAWWNSLPVKPSNMEALCECAFEAGQRNALRAGGEVAQLPPLTDLMYHAVRGSEYHFTSGGESMVVGYLDDDCLDEIWDNINTALRTSALTRAKGGQG